MISSFSTSGGLDRLELRVRKRMTQVDAGDLGTEIDARPADGDAGTLRHDRPRNARIDPLVHGAASVIFPISGAKARHAGDIGGQACA